ncbi:formate dehydrogenase family accessory protein FdhD [Thermodesulfatator indicus DSM 15286]|uniref:Sulfur carrier protein FdhD n=1 Tax=Thermodesulfatator indicus (strain DSM 15286 / JCM 11887 / CIR29812) TaxID=667014 RepID=F8AD14_THEID|nr:formate dehydrogenase accessory sulfurtransferase FdhD [Thermodesulfatator indicus]AEH45880.1 formate dehydrogenase family accessory protein FdhD [Thermodesulfatator indicus DSM 15286]
MLTLTLKHRTQLKSPNTEEEREEEVILERPYRIYLNEEPVGSSMVLPTGLEEFGVGFLFAQGYFDNPTVFKEVRLCHEKGSIFVYADVEKIEGKDLIVTSGCGGTGKISREFLEKEFSPLAEWRMKLSEVREFILKVLKKSDLGLRTHCVHACGYWENGRLSLFYEDVGRHNAVDKVVGAILMGKASPKGAIYTTGRLTSDMVLKCARVGIPIVMSRTATSSLGLEIAKKAGITLICYARPERINIFNAPERIINDLV